MQKFESIKWIVSPTTQDYKVWYKNKFYVDKTSEIVKLKEALQWWSAIFFSRPRRWWKSLFLSAIKHFFWEDDYKKEYFEWKIIEKNKDLMERAWKSIVISLDLKPLYSRETKTVNYDLLYH